MKKLFSLAMAILMLFCCVLGSGSAFAYTADTVPESALGDTASITVPYTNIEQVIEGDTLPEDTFFVKFIPPTTGYYEFRFDRKFSSTGRENALICAIYDMENDTYLSTAMCMNITADIAELAAYYGVTDNPSVASKLTAGKPYALYILCTVKNGWSANVTVQGHTHTLKTFTEKSRVDEDNLSWSTDGEKYVGCTANNCTYHVKKETYYRVKSVKLSQTKYTYSGKQKKPTVTVKDRKGNKLKKGTDYTVTYKNNTKIGTAKATVKFKGHYTGKVVKTYKINPKGTKISQVTAGKKAFFVKWKKQSAQTTGYQIQYSADKTFKKEKKRKNVTVSKNTVTSKTVKKLKAKKTYYVRVRTYKKVGDKKYYSGWSKTVKVTTKK